jgi:hypothetical protein
MSNIAERNRLIKKVLTAEFGAGKVSVKGSRGTAYGWVTVKIDVAPKDRDDRDAKKARVWELFKANKIQIGTYGYNDPGSDYGYGSKINIEFAQCQDVFNEGERVTWEGKTGTIEKQNYNNPGWYFLKWDGDTGTSEFYKRDLKRIEPPKDVASEKMAQALEELAQ